MDFTNLREHYHELLIYLEMEEYAAKTIRLVRNNIDWILRVEKHKAWQSYLDIYYDRVQKSESELYKKGQRTLLRMIRQFDLHEEYPTRGVKNPLIKQGSYHRLIPEFKNIIDSFRTSENACGLKDSSIKTYSNLAAAFLYKMQERGRYDFGCISEEDVISFFLDGKGNLTKCSSYKKSIAAVFNVVADWKEDECLRLLAYLPQIGPRRKNIQYLTPEEVISIRSAIDDKNSGLSLRNRAIGNLLFFTGIRACDIAEMKLSSIDWEADEICIPQQEKSNQPLILPLTAIIGNSILDYLSNERPKSAENHLFLSELYPHRPFGAGTVWKQATNIYNAASIRQNKGDRRGTHLFRHNVATSLLNNGVPRPIISQTLGQADPTSLNPYLHTAFGYLKKCALSIDGFPFREGVFCP